MPIRTTPSSRTFLPLLLLVVGAFASSAVPASPPPLTCTGKVNRVIDGDTIRMDCNAKRIRVRLSQIDAPETQHGKQPGQPWGNKSRYALEQMIGGQPIKMVSNGTDRYRRVLGILYIGNRNLNLEMVRTGNAWAYTQYVTDDTYFDAQDQAKAAGRGLWSLPASQRQQPWVFRKALRASRKRTK